MDELPITGYRKLTEQEVGLVNKIKAKTEELGVLIAELKSDPDLDHRWVSIAQTHFQEGSMAAVRSVTKPTTF